MYADTCLETQKEKNTHKIRGKNQRIFKKNTIRYVLNTTYLYAHTKLLMYFCMITHRIIDINAQHVRFRILSFFEKHPNGTFFSA